MKAISLWNPWATAIALGLKKIETRGWLTSYRGPLAIHAAKKDDGDASFGWRDMDQVYRAIFEQAGYLNWKELPFGCVVATALLVDVQTTERLLANDKITPLEYRWGGYGPGRFGWLLENVVRLEKPVPARGFQQLWEWNAEGSK